VSLCEEQVDERGPEKASKLFTTKTNEKVDLSRPLSKRKEKCHFFLTSANELHPSNTIEMPIVCGNEKASRYFP